MSKTKRMIYIWGENLEFYDSLGNKSEWINERIREVREARGETVEQPTETPSNQGATPQDALTAMRERDKARLAQYRKENGLYDPTAV